jgi:hypothetical protein
MSIADCEDDDEAAASSFAVKPVLAVFRCASSMSVTTNFEGMLVAPSNHDPGR